MISIGTVVLGLAIFEGIVGMVRGFLKELGVTLVLIATLFAVDLLMPIIVKFINNGGLQFLGLGPVLNSHTTQLVLGIIFTVIMVAAGYVSYQGETLAYEGTAPKGILGFLLGLLIGMVNGYLLFGTIWWIWNYLQYPFGLVETPLPATAAAVVNGGLLPPDLLAGGIEPNTFGLLPFILITLVVLKVLR